MLLLLVIGLFLLISSFPSGETAAWGIALLVSMLLLWRRSKEPALPRGLVNILTFPFLLLCLSLHGIYTHPLADFFKDCWYFSLPLVYLTFGYLAYERLGHWQRLIRPMVFAGLAIAIYLLVHAARNRGELAAASSLYAYRELTGFGSLVPIVPVILLLLSQRLRLAGQRANRWKMLRMIVYILCTAGVLVSFSRTNLVVLLAGVACTIDYRATLRRLLQGGVVPALVLLSLTAGAYYLAQSRSGPVQLFLTHLSQSSSEVKIRAYETFAEINDNWRGFEAYRATRTFASYSNAEKLFGGGGGSLVDLGIIMNLSTAAAGPQSQTEAFRFIPILHNGYMYLLVKTGILGLCLFVLFILQLLIISRRAVRLRDPQARFAGLALLWTCIVMVTTQGFITGIYNKGDLIPILFLAGASAASYAQRRGMLEAPARARVALFGLPRMIPAAGD